MHVMVVDVRGKLAHFRRPDTTVTHATYPFITRTAVLGMMAAIVGKDHLSPDHLVGIRLLSPVHTSAQQLSLLGKGWLGESAGTFNRPTVVELVVSPAYRLFLSGPDAREIANMVAANRSCYHTYLGCAFCLTVPEYVGLENMVPIDPGTGQLEVSSVVPTSAVDSLIPHPGRRYGRVGGMKHRELHDRRFVGAVHLVYEVSGQPIVLRPKADQTTEFVRTAGGEVICLW